MTVNELIDRYNAGERDFSSEFLSGFVLCKCHLSNISFRDSVLIKADLTGANLTQADFSRASMYGARLHETNLTKANLTRANLHKAHMVEAVLYGANLNTTVLTGANLAKADLTGANLAGANFFKANLRGAYLSGANLNSTILVGADLTHASYAPLHLLAQMQISNLSRDLTVELMRWDEAMRVFGGPSFVGWARGGDCPFSGAELRAFNFKQWRDWYVEGPPTMSFGELFRAVCKELEIVIG